jgi:hypothetical protein
MHFGINIINLHWEWYECASLLTRVLQESEKNSEGHCCTANARFLFLVDQSGPASPWVCCQSFARQARPHRVGPKLQRAPAQALDPTGAMISASFFSLLQHQAPSHLRLQDQPASFVVDATTTVWLRPWCRGCRIASAFHWVAASPWHHLACAKTTTHGHGHSRRNVEETP